MTQSKAPSLGKGRWLLRPKEEKTEGIDTNVLLFLRERI